MLQNIEIISTGYYTGISNKIKKVKHSVVFNAEQKQETGKQNGSYLLCKKINREQKQYLRKKTITDDYNRSNSFFLRASN